MATATTDAAVLEERYILVIVHKSHPTKVARLQPRSQSIVDQAILAWREDHCVD